jgi:hypothetical protein
LKTKAAVISITVGMSHDAIFVGINIFTIKW